jgi:biotin carboxylase
VVEGDLQRDARGARLLVLGAGPAQLGLLAAARSRDLYVIAADRDPAAPGFRFADRRALISAEDESGIERLASAENVDGIIAPGIDWPVAIAARVAERLALPHPIRAETGLLSTSKLRQRERFAEAGVPQPAFVVCSGLDEAAAAAQELGYPCVVKAPDRQGQRGLTLVSSARELRAAVEVALAASRSATVLVEAHVPSRELTVNAFSIEGRFRPLTVTDRLTAELPAFGVALAHVWPSELESPVIGAAIEAAGAAAAALGIETGPTYTQVLVAEDGRVVVGELAARLGGGHDAELCRAVLGVDLNGLALAAALGRPVRPGRLAPTEKVGGGCIRFLVAPPGELREVEGVRAAFELDGVKGIRLYRRPGYRFGPLRRGADRAGAILAVGDSRDDALARADRAAKLIRFDVVPVETPLEKV